MTNPDQTTDKYAELIRRLNAVSEYEHAAQGVRELARETAAALAEMQGVVERLPVTKDGVRVIPGVDPVYREQHAGGGEYYIACLYDKAVRLIESSYASREAAEAAIAARKGE